MCHYQLNTRFDIDTVITSLQTPGIIHVYMLLLVRVLLPVDPQCELTASYIREEAICYHIKSFLNTCNMYYNWNSEFMAGEVDVKSSTELLGCCGHSMIIITYKI